MECGSLSGQSEMKYEAMLPNSSRVSHTTEMQPDILRDITSNIDEKKPEVQRQRQSETLNIVLRGSKKKTTNVACKYIISTKKEVTLDSLTFSQFDVKPNCDTTIEPVSILPVKVLLGCKQLNYKFERTTVVKDLNCVEIAPMILQNSDSDYEIDIGLVFHTLGSNLWPILDVHTMENCDPVSSEEGEVVVKGVSIDSLTGLPRPGTPEKYIGQPLHWIGPGISPQFDTVTDDIPVLIQSFRFTWNN